MHVNVGHDLVNGVQGYRETDRGHARGTGCDLTGQPVPLCLLW